MKSATFCDMGDPLLFYGQGWASVVISAFSAWRESSRECWTTIGWSDSMTEA